MTSSSARRRAKAHRKAIPRKPREIAAFEPVAMRTRHDGFTPERQIAFIDALAESGCVEEACRHVGVSSTAAYALRRRIDAVSFRMAWEAALDYAVRRLSDLAFSRAIHGVARPVFYKGEQIGERRYYDERLTQFILRYRDPTRYGRFMDRMIARRAMDGAAIGLAKATDHVAEDAYAMADGDAPPPHPPVDELRIEFPETDDNEAMRDFSEDFEDMIARGGRPDLRARPKRDPSVLPPELRDPEFLGRASLDPPRPLARSEPASPDPRPTSEPDETLSDLPPDSWLEDWSDPPAPEQERDGQAPSAPPPWFRKTSRPEPSVRSFDRRPGDPWPSG